MGVVYEKQPRYESFRHGDVMHSHADVTRARLDFGYSPSHSVSEGIRESVEWYFANSLKKMPRSDVEINKRSSVKS